VGNLSLKGILKKFQFRVLGAIAARRYYELSKLLGNIEPAKWVYDPNADWR
jgi:hypothetical protein